MSWPEVDGPNRTLLWLGFMLVAAALVRDRPRPSVAETLALPGFAMEDVADFTLSQGEEHVRIERKGNDWTISEPVHAAGPVPRERAESWLRAWSKPLRSEQKVASDLPPHELAQLGLARHDTLRFVVESARDHEILSLEIGDLAPRGGRYVRLEGFAAIFVTPLPETHLSASNPSAWAEHRLGGDPLFALPPTGPVAARWQAGDRSVSLLRDDSGVWSQEGGHPPRASTWAEALAPLTPLVPLGRTDAPAETDDLRELSLSVGDAPPLVLHVVPPEESARSVAARVGDEWFVFARGTFDAWFALD